MYLLLVIFLTSFVGLVAMIFYRRWELNTGKVLSQQNVREPLFSVDVLLEELRRQYQKFPKAKVETALRTVYYNSKRIIGKSSQSLNNAMFKKHVDRVINSVRGKQELTPRGESPSPFIKDILAHKEKIREENEK